MVPARKYKPNLPAKAVTYVQLTLPFSVSTDAPQINALREIITLQTQGEAVEVSENHPTALLMVAFDVVHRTSPEMILRLSSGRRVLLFDHWDVPVLRDKDIYLLNKISDPKESKKFTPELIIDLEGVWKKVDAKEGDENLQSIKSALGEIKRLTRPAMVATLVGEAPALLFLLTQHMLHGKAGEIWYQEKSTSRPIQITYG